jgi:hypothetical protein
LVTEDAERRNQAYRTDPEINRLIDTIYDITPAARA